MNYRIVVAREPAGNPSCPQENPSPGLCCNTPKINHRLSTASPDLPTRGPPVAHKLSTDSSTTRSRHAAPPTSPGDNPGSTWGWTVDRSTDLGDGFIHNRSHPQASSMVHKLPTAVSTTLHTVRPAQSRLIPTVHIPYYYDCFFSSFWKKRKKKGQWISARAARYDRADPPRRSRGPDDARTHTARSTVELPVPGRRPDGRDTLADAGSCRRGPRREHRISTRPKCPSKKFQQEVPQQATQRLEAKGHP